MSDPHGTQETHPEQDHAPDGHGAAAGHAEGAHGHDSHGHGGMDLGAFDGRMWLVGIVGVLVALLITAGFAVATGFQFLEYAVG